MEPPPPDMPMFMQRKSGSNPQEQRHQRQDGGRGGGSAGQGRGGGRGGGRRSENTKWCNEGMSHHRPQSDFERFQNQDYGSGSGNGNGNGGGYHSGRGGYRGGGRGGRY